MTRCCRYAIAAERRCARPIESTFGKKGFIGKCFDKRQHLFVCFFEHCFDVFPKKQHSSEDRFSNYRAPAKKGQDSCLCLTVSNSAEDSATHRGAPKHPARFYRVRSEQYRRSFLRRTFRRLTSTVLRIVHLRLGLNRLWW